jgi:hypothetical protein
MSAEELSSWLRDHPDAVVFRCGCIWTEPTMAAISQTWPMDCPKHRPAQFRPGQFLPFKP